MLRFYRINFFIKVRNESSFPPFSLLSNKAEDESLYVDLAPARLRKWESEGTTDARTGVKLAPVKAALDRISRLLLSLIWSDYLFPSSSWRFQRRPRNEKKFKRSVNIRERTYEPYCTWLRPNEWSRYEHVYVDVVRPKAIERVINRRTTTCL